MSRWATSESAHLASDHGRWWYLDADRLVVVLVAMKRPAGQTYVSSRFRAVQKTRPLPRWYIGERGPELVITPRTGLSTYTQFFTATLQNIDRQARPQ